MNFMMQAAIIIWTNFHILLPGLPTPPQAVPIMEMGLEPAGIDRGLIGGASKWMDCTSLQKNFYDSSRKELLWADDFSAQMDVLAKSIMSEPIGARTLFEWHCFSSPYESAWTTNLANHDNGCKDIAGNFVTFTDSNGQVRPYTCPYDLSAGQNIGYKKWVTLTQALKSRGVVIDFFITENEQGLSYWGMDHNYHAAIRNDPRFADFSKLLGIPDLEPFIHENILKFDAELFKRTSAAFTNSVYKALFESYPNLRGHVFDYAKFTASYVSPKIGPNGVAAGALDFNGWEAWKYGSASDFTVAQSPDMSLECGQLCTANDQAAITGPFPLNNWNTFIYAYNLAAATALSHPEGNFWPLLGPTSFHHDNPFYPELMLHMALMGNNGFVFWNPPNDSSVAAWQTSMGLDPNDPKSRKPTDAELAAFVASQHAKDVNDYKVINVAMKDIDANLGFVDRKSQLKDLVSWQSTSIMTCATANRVSRCRVTNQDGSSSWK